MPFEFQKAELNGVLLVTPRVFPDERGFFMETYKESDFRKSGIGETFTQDNHSMSKKGVLRGLHFQYPPAAQGKLVRVMSGAVWDVAVDIRKGSPSFGRWYAVELSSANSRMIYIPPGFAHGFVALSDDVHLLYKCTVEYDAALDAGIRWDDPDIGIQWPVKNPAVSDKDGALPLLGEIGHRL